MRVKYLILPVLLFHITLVVSAQHKNGSFSLQPKIGMASSTFTGDDINGCKTKVGFTIGGDVEYQCNPWLGLSCGVLYTNEGAKIKNTESIGLNNASIKTNYLNIPIVMNFYVAKGLAFKAGLQPGILLSAKIHAKVADVKASIDVGSSFHSLDMTIPVGVSYELHNIVLDGRYHFGLSKIADYRGQLWKDVNLDSDPKMYNGFFTITIGYKFDL